MQKKKAFSVVPKALPWRPNHMTICQLRHSGESLQNGQLKLQRRNWYFARGYSRISLSLSGRILKEYLNIVSVSTCGIPWGLWNRTHWSAHYTNGHDVAQQESSFELYKLNLLSPHCRSIARELVHCYTWGHLRIVTVHGNTAGRHRPHAYTVYWRI